VAKVSARLTIDCLPFTFRDARKAVPNPRDFDSALDPRSHSASFHASGEVANGHLASTPAVCPPFGGA
jgi:hypothetical protein